MKVYMLDKNVFPKYDFSIERGIIEGAGYEYYPVECKDEKEVLEKCSDADVICSGLRAVSPETMDGLKNCKALIKYGIGYDIYDADEAAKRGIKVCNIPNYCTEEVSEHTTSMILAISRNLLAYTMNMRKGLYDKGADQFRKMHKPEKQTVGLVGFGKISRTVSDHLKVIGFNVLAYDPFLDDDVFREKGVERVDLDELYARSDIISLHASANKSSFNMINENSIAKMKDGVAIINNARAALINEGDLIKALESGKVSAAALDIFEDEPLVRKDHPFYHMDNVIMTPHAAFISEESTPELCRLTAVTSVKVLRGEYLDNLVNRRQLIQYGFIKE